MANTVKENKESVVLKRIDEAISKLEKKDFSMFFYIVDSKNVPNSCMEYMYSIALEAKRNGYDVKMCYQLENEYTGEEIAKLMRKGQPVDERRVFVGVDKWLGEEYASLEHINVATTEWAIGPQDFLFIPEALSSLMQQTYARHIPCKRIVVLRNYDYVTDYIPFGAQWSSFGINEAISVSESQSAMLRNVFPYVKTRVLNPGIPELFRKPVSQKKLIVNIVSKNQDDVNRVMKPFHWKYPLFRFVSFRDLRGKSRKDFAEALKEAAITVWLDDDTSFGMTPLEAMRCGSIVVGKIPENLPEWMYDDEDYIDNGVWFANMNELPDILSSLVTSWMNDSIPEKLSEAMEKTNVRYTMVEFEANAKKLFDELVNERINEIKAVRNTAENKKEKEEEN